MHPKKSTYSLWVLGIPRPIWQVRLQFLHYLLLLFLMLLCATFQGGKFNTLASPLCAPVCIYQLTDHSVGVDTHMCASSWSCVQ
jgi:hypothetical protein